MNNYVLNITKKSFTKGDDVVEYYELFTIIDNERITLQVKDCDKKLFKFLLKSKEFNERGVLVD